MSDKWNAGDMPSLDGKIAIVTGANSGLGYYTARDLARRGARTIMACRSMDRAESARDALLAELDHPEIEVMELDLANLGSVRAFADAFQEKFDKLDLLINNAGIMAIPRRETADGFEMQIGVNHLGHFALTGNLLDMLESVHGAKSRVVNVSSGAHQGGEYSLRRPALAHRSTRSGARTHRASWRICCLPTSCSVVSPRQTTACSPRPFTRAMRRRIYRLAGPDMEGSTLKRKFMELRTTWWLSQPRWAPSRRSTQPQRTTLRAATTSAPTGSWRSRDHPIKVESNKKSNDPERARASGKSASARPASSSTCRHHRGPRGGITRKQKPRSPQ